MSKKSKKSDAPEEKIIAEETVAETSEPAEENIAVSEEPMNIEPMEEVNAVEADGAENTASDTKNGTVSRPVNFRTGPSFGKAVIAELKAGAKVVITGTEAGDKGDWYKCEFDGRTGYVKASGVVAEK